MWPLEKKHRYQFSSRNARNESAREILTQSSEPKRTVRCQASVVLRLYIWAQVSTAVEKEHGGRKI